MKNHLERIGLRPRARPTELEAALTPGPDTDEQLAADIAAAREILLVPERRLHYERLHLQYRAMAAALPLLDAPGAVDSHRWHERLVEFEEPVPPAVPPA